MFPLFLPLPSPPLPFFLWLSHSSSSIPLTFDPLPGKVMVRGQIPPSAHIFLPLLVLLCLSCQLTQCHSLSLERHHEPPSDLLSPQPPRPPTLGDDGEKGRTNDAAEEEEEELFKDIDPKTLAAVLLEALNKPQGGRSSQGVTEEEEPKPEKTTEEEEEELEVKRGQEETQQEEEEEGEQEREVQKGVKHERGDGREELELIMAAAAAQGREEREREEEEERKRAQEEEERLTEKVTSRTTSQTLPLKQPKEEEQKDEPIKFGNAPNAEEEEEEEEEEEQLSPEEVKNLQSMLEEFQSYSQQEAGGGGAEEEKKTKGGQERESRGGRLSDPMDTDYTDNSIWRPKGFRGYNLGLKKKLKWKQQQQKEQQEQEQEQEQELMNDQPMKANKSPNKAQAYRGGNFMDDFDKAEKEEQRQQQLQQGEEEEQEDQDEGEEEEEEEEKLSPEEEEARAKAEQEEVRRQAAEAQRAKAEEEKLADMASDMLLQYMMKQDGRKAQEQRKKNLLLGMNAVEDKRSDEEEEDMEDDDIDPQTIDKLIEISSKLHLPADDVVDILSDVEKKKKKDAPESFAWQRPLLPVVDSQALAPAPVAPVAPRFPSTSIKQSPLPDGSISPFKSWLKDRTMMLKPSKQDFWMKKPQKQQPFRGYPPAPAAYPFYPKAYPGYYPFYFPQPKPRYYAKPSYAFSPVLGNAVMDYDFDFPPKRRYRPWAQPARLRSPGPAALRRNLYFPNYILPPPHSRTFAAVPMPKPRSPVRHRSAFYYPPPASLVTRANQGGGGGGGGGYYGQRRPSPQQQQDSDEELENYIEKVFLKRPRMFQ